MTSKQAFAKVRALCLALPDTREGSHFEKAAFYAGKKMFATCVDKDGRCEVAFGLEPQDAMTLLETDPRFKAYPRAKHALVVDAAALGDWKLLRALHGESLRARRYRQAVAE